MGARFPRCRERLPGGVVSLPVPVGNSRSTSLLTAIAAAIAVDDASSGRTPTARRPAACARPRAGLVAAGEIERETERGAMAWRMIKSGVAGFSVGFMAKSEPRPGGGRRLTEVDLLEISITSRPMNASTRALNWKAATDELPTEADQRRRMARLMMTPEQQRDLDDWLGVFNQSIGGTKATAPATKSKGPVRLERFPVE